MGHTGIFVFIPQAAEVPLITNTRGNNCSQCKTDASAAYLPGTSTLGAEQLLDPLQGFCLGKNLCCEWK